LRHDLWISLAALLVLAAGSLPLSAQPANPRVLIKTSMGDITLELDRAKAPITVKNFLSYVQDKFYDGTIFHRVIDGFMIQGGGLTADMNQKAGYPPIKNESGNGLRNARGSVAMARTNDLNSATSQFFINLVDNAALDHVNDAQYGYAVFGKVVEGMDIVNKIAAAPTGSGGPFPKDVPVEKIIINKAAVVEAK